MSIQRTWESFFSLANNSPRAVIASNLGNAKDMSFTVEHGGTQGEITIDIADCDGNRIGLTTVTAGNSATMTVTIPGGNWAAMIFLPPGNGTQAITMRIGPRPDDGGPPPPNPSNGGGWFPKIPTTIDEIKQIIPNINWETPYYF